MDSQVRFPIHHDCLMDVITYLSFDCLIQEKIAHLSLALVLLVEEFVFERVQLLIDTFVDVGIGTISQIREKLINQSMLDIWDNQSPIFESTNEMKNRIEQLCEDKRKELVSLFIETVGLEEGKIQDCLFGLFRSWLEGSKFVLFSHVPVKKNFIK